MIFTGGNFEECFTVESYSQVPIPYVPVIIPQVNHFNHERKGTFLKLINIMQIERTLSDILIIVPNRWRYLHNYSLMELCDPICRLSLLETLKIAKLYFSIYIALFTCGRHTDTVLYIAFK